MTRNRQSLSPKALTLYYSSALFLVAGLSIASHLLLNNALHRNEGSAAVINLSGRQRMLSQRIAGLAAQIRLGDDAARLDLRSAITDFETVHDSLVADSRASSVDEEADSHLRAIYFDGTNALDPQVRAFVADARRALELKVDDPAMAVVSERLFSAARLPLLSALNEVVTNRQREAEGKLDQIQRLQWAILVTILVTLLVEAVSIFRPMVGRMTTVMAELFKLATTDSLTGAANRRHFMEASKAEVARARRYSRPLSLLMLDADHFKSVNDTYGHAAGDAVLVGISTVIRQTIRDSDIYGRLGGEEFAVLLVETPLAGATELAERLRQRIEAMVVRHEDVEIKRTVSIGVTVVLGEAGLDSALEVADALMYQAKQTGRNRVAAPAMTEGAT